MWRGAWDEAEHELTSACEELAICRPAMTTEGLARLGELRRRQGRRDEAATLFERSGAHPIAALGRVGLALDAGDARTAAELAERHLRRLPAKNRTGRAPTLEMLIRALVQCGSAADLDAARNALKELYAIANGAQTAPLLASASHCAGLIAAAKGDLSVARRHLEDAVDLFEKSGAPFESAAARLDLACVLQTIGRIDPALAEVERALEALTPLGAGIELARAKALHAGLTGAESVANPEPRDPTSLTAREVEVLRLISGGLSNKAIAERLFISEHTVHRHVGNTLSKLNVPSRSAAVAQAARLGLL
jgi:ATP/maltotriose-dependent transcriptional regulator MalT